MVSACSARPGGDQEKPSAGRSHTRSSPTPRLPVPPQPRQPPQPLHSLKTSPAAVGRSAARSTSTRSLATGSSTCWTSGGESGDGTCSGACARSSVCAPGCSTGSTGTLFAAGNGACHEQRRLAGDAGDRRAVPERGDDQTPGVRMARRRGTRRASLREVDQTAPPRHALELQAKCLKELHSPALQEANTHRLFIKLCWLMDKHAASADRVVNIDETYCRLLPVHQTAT